MLSPLNQKINLTVTGIALYMSLGFIASLLPLYNHNTLFLNTGYRYVKYHPATVLTEANTVGFLQGISGKSDVLLTLALFLILVSGALLMFYRKKGRVWRLPFNNLSGVDQKQAGAISHHNNTDNFNEHESRLTSVFDNLPGFVYRCKNDEHWTMLYISDGCKNITGYGPMDFLNNNQLSYNSIIKPKYRSHLKSVWNHTLANRSAFIEEYEIVTADNHTKWLQERGVGIFDQSGNLLFLEGYIEDISERKFTQSKLIENEEKFRKLFHNHAAVKLLIDPETGNIVDANEAAAKFYGWSIEELLKLNISQINILPENEIKQNFKDAVKNNNIHFEFRHRKANGDVVNIDVFTSKIVIGNKIYLHSIIHDISEKQRAIGMLRESEERNRLIMDNSMDAILLTKPDGSILSANKAACTMFGMTEQELVDAGRDGVVDLNDPQLPLLLQRRAVNHLAEGEITFIRKDGSRFPAHISSALFKNSNGEVFSSMIIRDITQSKKAEDELRASNEFNKTLMQTIPFAMNIVDENGVILFQNARHKELYGGTINNHKCYELFRTDKSRCSGCPLDAGLENGKTKTIESDGIIGGRTFEITHTGMLFNGKKAILEIFQDITDRKNWETELLAAKEKAEVSDRLKTAFLANMSHEIRTPMNGIMGFIGLLDNPDISKKARKDHLHIIKESGQRLLDTINDIIEFSKIEAGESKLNYSLENLTEIMQFHYNIFKPLATEQGIDLIISEQLTGNAALISTDRSKLDSILTNLIKNAFKFTSEGKIQLGNYLKDDDLVFYVKDTGPGIPADKMDVIFERFVQADMSLTRAHEGSGLGLSITKAYVEAFGGNIRVESEVGKGSTFYFTIPYHTVVENGETLPGPEMVPEPEVPEKRILIAEDDEISYMYLEFILEQEEIQVIRTASGTDTVKAIMANPDVALILMDIKMPEMDGLEATKEIRKFNTTIPIVAQTAYALAGDRQIALEAGCNDYITKPVDKGELINVLKKYYF